MTDQIPELSPQGPLVTVERTGTTAFLLLLKAFARAVKAALADILAAQQVIEDQVDLQAKFLRGLSSTRGMVPVAAADGATAKITIPDHVRIYYDKEVEVAGAVLTGLPYDLDIILYYDDATRDGVPDFGFQTTVDPNVASTSADFPNRHTLGGVRTPATAGSPPVPGTGTPPPGFPRGGGDFDTP